MNTSKMPTLAILETSLPSLQSSGKQRSPKVDAIIVGVTSERKVASSSVTKFLASAGVDLTSPLEAWPEYAAKVGEVLEVPTSISVWPSVSRILLVGIGNGDADSYRKVGATIGRKVKGSDKSVLIGLPKDATSKKSCSSFFASLVIAQYVWTLKTTTKATHSTVLIYPERDAKDLVTDLAQSLTVIEGVWRARDLIHTPSNIKNPEYLAQQAKKFVAKSGASNLTVKVRAGKELEKFGGVRAVGNSSPKPGPRVIEISYKPRGGKKVPHVVIVGKGITFDTGGISLKRPYDTMMAMKSDMAGASAVLATTLAVAELKLPVRVTGLMMCAENALSGTSQRPSDVITHFGGKTVEVLNTDAEGRLVLADGLAYADLQLDPDYIVDIATLTGSATLGLGRQYAAMYTRDEKLAKKLYEAGQKTGDRVWHMPLVDDYKSSLASDIADINHTADKSAFQAGSVTAALFLEEFVGSRKWVHLDIAGTGRSEIDAGENVKGGTGFGVRLLAEWISTL